MTSEDDLTHTERVVREHPEAAKAVADMYDDEMKEYLYRVLEEQGQLTGDSTIATGDTDGF